MKTQIAFLSLLLSTFVSILSFAAPAQAQGAVGPCAQDQITSERSQDVPPDKRLKVLNSKGTVVGALVRDSNSGDIDSLYLCGNNSGYYYAKGNINEGVITDIYNDEYESEFDTDVTNGVLVVSLKIKFGGEAEDADYPPFSAKLFIPLKN